MRFFWLLFFIVFRYGESNERLQPDILLVVADDAGHADVGWYNEKMRSPFLDSLANDEKSTIRFDRFYAYPTCSPTRGALMSDRYAHENSMTFAVIGPRSISGVDPKLPFFTKSLKDTAASKPTNAADRLNRVGLPSSSRLPVVKQLDRRSHERRDGYTLFGSKSSLCSR